MRSILFGSVRFFLSEELVGDELTVTLSLDEQFVQDSIGQLECRVSDSTDAVGMIEAFDPYSCLDAICDEPLVIDLSGLAGLFVDDLVVHALRERVDVLRLALSNLVWNLEGPVTLVS